MDLLESVEKYLFNFCGIAEQYLVQLKMQIAKTNFDLTHTTLLNEELVAFKYAALLDAERSLTWEDTELPPASFVKATCFDLESIND